MKFMVWCGNKMSGVSGAGKGGYGFSFDQDIKPSKWAQNWAFGTKRNSSFSAAGLRPSPGRRVTSIAVEKTERRSETKQIFVFNLWDASTHKNTGGTDPRWPSAELRPHNLTSPDCKPLTIQDLHEFETQQPKNIHYNSQDTRVL